MLTCSLSKGKLSQPFVEICSVSAIVGELATLNNLLKIFGLLHKVRTQRKYKNNLVFLYYLPSVSEM